MPPDTDRPDSAGPDALQPETLRPETLRPETRLECGICWAVYDPALGDEVWQIPPGTPFAELPPHWTCPNCAAEQHKFLVLHD